MKIICKLIKWLTFNKVCLGYCNGKKTNNKRQKAKAQKKAQRSTRKK